MPYFFMRALHIIPWVHLKDQDSDQLAIVDGMQYHDRNAVRSGHKVSKSNTLVGSALYQFVTQHMGRVPCTSSSFLQVKQIIWYELKLVFRAAEQRGEPLGGTLYEDPQTGLVLPDGRQIFGFSTREPERAAGISGRAIRYKIDEASGVLEPNFEAIEGNRAGGAGVDMFSNPTRTSGYFFESFHTKRSFWNLIHIPSWNSPNVQAKRIIVPGLATEQWIDEKREEWGEKSPLFQVRVAGNFPSESERSVISIDLLQQSTTRYKMLEDMEEEYDPTYPLILGVDPTYGGGDEAVIAPVRGKRSYPFFCKIGLKDRAIALAVIETARKYRIGSEHIFVIIDEIGYGSATLARLNGEFARTCKELRMSCVGVNVSTKSRYPSKYGDLRTELAFLLRDWMELDGAIWDDPKLAAECVAPEYDIDTKGRYILPSKKKEKDVLKRSPNRRDALQNAMYPTTTHGAKGEILVGINRQIWNELAGYL
jgi:hypothetical protein